jgi:ATP-binding cassette subfamily C protein
MFVAAGFEMVGVSMFLPLLQLLVSPNTAPQNFVLEFIRDVIGADSDKQFIIIFSFCILAFFSIKNLALGIIIFIQNSFIARHRAIYAQSLLRHYLNKPYDFHLQRNTTELIRNTTILSSRIFVKGLLPVLQFSMELLIIAGIAIVLMLVDPVATLVISGVLGGTVGLFYMMIRGRVKDWGRQVIHYDGQILLWVTQALGSIKETKLYCHENFFVDAFAKPSNAQSGFLARSATVPHLPRLLIEAVAIGALVLLVVLMISQPGDSIASVVPKLGLFAIAAMRLMPSLSKLFSALTSLRDNVAAVDTLYADLKDGIALRQYRGDDQRSQTAFSYTRDIRLEKLSYSYPQTTQNVVDGVDLVIERGQSVAFVGASGAGKTTLVDLVLGLLEPTSGDIRVDGRDIHHDLDGWQSLIGYIPQDTYVTDDTLRRNIALGRTDAEIDHARIERVLDLAQLTSFVEDLPQGLETDVGERGARLSGGQRQRIGIARALYHDPDVLVMDEATSALDGETEKEITAAIDQLSGDKTLIVIAHRLSTVRHCDVIVLLEDGRIIDQGSFASLAERNAEFQQLVELGSADTGGSL